MGRVHLLSDALINQIAAGEVVERPASVVKELAENAVDAGAQSVRVALSEGGLAAISVVDDGSGMSREDAVLALARHATSKLRSAQDLQAIGTFGFRGEALPAIASVSRFRLHTSEPGQPLGTRLAVDGGEPLQVEDAPPAHGTRIDVLELFFNTPARRKFMRREATELAHCEEAVLRLMLAWPQVGFWLEHGGRSLIASPGGQGDLKDRIAQALGPEVHPHLLPVQADRLGVRLSGYVASPEFTLPNARGLYVFVNRRYVRDRGVTFAVQRAFAEALPAGRQPVAVLFLEIDPALVDVNVHPQKLEVRFSDARMVQEALHAGISGALKAAPWRGDGGAAPAPLDGPSYALAVERFLDRARAGGTTAFEPAAAPESAEPLALGFGQARPGINEAPPPGWFGQLRYLGDLAQRFWICEAPTGSLVVLDPRAVHERIFLQRFTKALQDPAGKGQPGLFQATVELPADAARALLASSVPPRLGLALEPFGGSAVAVRGVPPELAGPGLEALLLDLAQVLPPAGEAGAPPRLAPAVKVLASHAARAAPRAASFDEVRAILRELDDADFDLAAHHPTVVVRELPLLELERLAD